MTDRRSPDEPLAALERSLRAGPADESGYRADALDMRPVASSPWTTRLGEGGAGARTPRRRRRVVPAPSFSFMGAVALGMVLAVGGLALLERFGRDGIGGPPASLSAPPSSRPSTSPLPVPALTETFVSTRNGFSVAYPAGWLVTAATTSWPQDSFLPPGNSALDELKLPGVARLLVASQALPDGQTEEEWLAAFFHPYPFGTACSEDHATWPRLEIDGRTGYLDAAGCPMPADTNFSTPDVQFDALVFAGGRVYQIALDGIVDRGYFDAFLDTIRLDPPSALDPSPGS